MQHDWAQAVAFSLFLNAGLAVKRASGFAATFAIVLFMPYVLLTFVVFVSVLRLVGRHKNRDLPT